MFSNLKIPALPHQFSGKWNHRFYRVLHELGKGANGIVYQVMSEGRVQALKIGSDPMDLLMEVNMLKSVQQRPGQLVGPALCDVDDVVINNQTYTFYSMEYLAGERLDLYIERVGRDWAPVAMVQLLSRLEVLHAQGWIFGDLKPENTIMARPEKSLRLIDFGGVTKVGNAVRQFTEDYDRAAWYAGDRRADVGYDLFAAAMVMIRLLLPQEEWRRIKKGTRHVHTLCDIIQENPLLKPYRHILVRALNGKYTRAETMKQDLMDSFVRMQGTKLRKKSNAGKWLGSVAIVMVLLAAGFLYFQKA